MSNIEALQGFGTQTDPKAAKSGAPLGKEDFLNLLVTQLKNQDPLNPSDPTEFTAQLAQYSSLEQLYNINDRMKAFESVEGGFERLSALSLIGKSVVAESDAFRFEGSPVELGCRFEEPVEEVRVSVKNESGQVVDEFPVNLPASGEAFFAWDGENAQDQQLPAGDYKLEIIGTREDGTRVEGAALVGSRVTGVDFLDSETALLTTNGRISASDVRRVNNPA